MRKLDNTCKPFKGGDRNVSADEKKLHTKVMNDDVKKNLRLSDIGSYYSSYDMNETSVTRIRQRLRTR